MNPNEAVPNDWREKPTIPVYPDAAAVLDLGRSAMYAAIERGDVPAIRIGRRLVIPTAKLRELIGEPEMAVEPDAADDPGLEEVMRSVADALAQAQLRVSELHVRLSAKRTAVEAAAH